MYCTVTLGTVIPRMFLKGQIETLQHRSLLLVLDKIEENAPPIPGFVEKRLCGKTQWSSSGSSFGYAEMRQSTSPIGGARAGTSAIIGTSVITGTSARAGTSPRTLNFGTSAPACYLREIAVNKYGVDSGVVQPSDPVSEPNDSAALVPASV